MNRRPSNSLPPGKAITGFITYKTAEGLSQSSVDSYQRILEHWAEYSGNKYVAQFTDHDINSDLVYTRTEYVPSRLSGDTRNLSPKTLRNIWITMCSFFRWANSEFHIESPMKNVPAPRFQKVEIEPFTREEVSRMLKACTYSREADTSYRRQFVMRRPTANRDQAAILTLLDSCVRASEFCAFRVGDFDPKRGKLEIRPGIEGGAHNYENQYMLNLARWRRKVEASVEYWIKRWNQHDGKLKPTLQFIGDSNVIFDSRCGDAAEHQIPPFAIQILKSLHRPLRTAHSIQQFGSDERELESQIGILKSYSLIFQEGGSMLSLVI